MMFQVPTIPFSQIVIPLPGDSAYKVVSSMTEEQVRYALWASMVLLFGSPECNATEIVIGTDLPKFKPIAEAHVILAQAGCSRCNKRAVESLVEELKDLK